MSARDLFTFRNSHFRIGVGITAQEEDFSHRAYARAPTVFVAHSVVAAGTRHGLGAPKA